MENLHVLVLEDHPIIRQTICTLLKNEYNNLEITELDKVGQIVKTLKNDCFTHLILDLKLQDGNTLEILPIIRDFFPKIKILIFSALPKKIYFQALNQYKIFDYLEKSIELNDLKFSLLDFINNSHLQKKQPIFDVNPFSKLTIKEFEVLNYLVSGINVKSIAEILNIHNNTVSTYKTRILEKTDMSNMKELIDLCTLWGIE